MESTAILIFRNKPRLDFDRFWRGEKLVSA
jgi:hypothetical protein